MAGSKTYDFILIFKGRSQTPANRISRMMLVFSVAVFVFTSIPFTGKSVMPLIITIAIIGWWTLTEIRLKKRKTAYFRLAFILAACGWFLQDKGWPIAIVYIVAALLEKQVKFPDEIAFDENEVVFNSFPRKHFAWNAFNNIILKDGLLTIDFKTNRLIQKQLESFPTIKEEAEFNTFCTTHLQTAASAL